MEIDLQAESAVATPKITMLPENRKSYYFIIFCFENILKKKWYYLFTDNAVTPQTKPAGAIRKHNALSENRKYYFCYYFTMLGYK